MAYPPATLPTNATDGTSSSDTTPTAVLTAAEVNATNAAVNDIVTELGANPSGSAADVGARIAAVEAAAGSIADGAVTTAKLAAGAVTAAKVAADVATQAELDAVAAAKADVGHNHSGTYAQKSATWATGVDYVVDERVINSGTSASTTAHTSGASIRCRQLHRDRNLTGRTNGHSVV